MFYVIIHYVILYLTLIILSLQTIWHRGLHSSENYVSTIETGPKLQCCLSYKPASIFFQETEWIFYPLDLDSNKYGLVSDQIKEETIWN